MANFIVIDPTKIYQINGVVTPLQSAFVTHAAGNNITVKSAITGQRIRIMGASAGSYDAAAGAVISFLNGSGGSIVATIHAPMSVDGQGFLPIVDSGYGESSTGVGIFCNIGTATGADVLLYYVAYTPL